MPPDSSPIGSYFDTPARAERLQLLLYLVRNAGEVIYLRAPAGAGKTLFAQRLFDTLSDQIAAVWVRGSEDCDVARAAADQLGLPPDSARHWPDAVLDGLDGQELLLIVDDADRLGLRVVEDLDLLHAHGGRLLLVGQGGLAETSGNWDLQFVDLPPFEAEQTAAFLRHQAGDQAARVTDDLAAGLHRAARGLPGPLLDALNGVLGGGGRLAARRQSRSAGPGATSRRPLWQWLGGAALILLLASVILFQDRVNEAFEADAPAPGRPTSPPVPSPADPMPEPGRPPAVVELVPLEAERMPPVIAPERTSPAAGPPIPASADGVNEIAPAVEAERSDPLEAVMQDALAAAGADPGKPEPAPGASAEPTADQPVESVPLPSIDIRPEESRVAETRSEEAPAPVEREVQTPAVPTPEKPEPEPLAPAPVASEAQSGPGPQKPAAADPVARPGGAPVESRDVPQGPPVVMAKPAVVVPEASPRRNASDWLDSRDPARYTLQLVGSRDRAAVGRFVRQHGIGQPHAIFERDLEGRPWYSLVAGDYPDRAAAIAARERLPDSLNRSGVWPRTFGSIKKSK